MRTGAAVESERLPPEVVSLLLRRRIFYMVEDAGLKLGLSRTQAYLAVKRGIIPVERYGKLLLVRRTTWDRKVKQLVRGTRSRRARNPAASRNCDRSRIEGTITKTPP